MSNFTYEQLRAMLPVHKHRLDDELEIHAQIQELISYEVTTKNSRAIQFKDDLVKVEARLAEDYREEDPKITINGISNKVARASERIRAWEKYQDARSEHERWSGLLEAWKQKGYAIRNLGDLYASQYFVMQSHQRKDRPDRPDFAKTNEADQMAMEAQVRIKSRRREETLKESEQAPTRRRFVE